MFFSVILPTYNRNGLLKNAISSVLQQTYPDFELIIVDDGSMDKTQELVQQYQDERIRYLYQSNHGVANARNRGIQQSRADLIAFLDSDDYWVPEKLEKTLEYIEHFPEISIFHTEEIWYKNGKILNQKRRHKKPSGFVFKSALPLCCISPSTAVLKKEVFESIGLFDEDFPACEDYDFWLRATHKYEVKLIPEPLTIKDGGRPDQLSNKIWGLDRFRIKALEKMLSSGNLDKEDYQAALQELKKKCQVYVKGAKKRGKTSEASYYKNLPNQYIMSQTPFVSLDQR